MRFLNRRVRDITKWNCFLKISTNSGQNPMRIVVLVRFFCIWTRKKTCSQSITSLTIVECCIWKFNFDTSGRLQNEVGWIVWDYFCPLSHPQCLQCVGQLCCWELSALLAKEHPSPEVTQGDMIVMWDELFSATPLPSHCLSVCCRAAKPRKRLDQASGYWQEGGRGGQRWQLEGNKQYFHLIM